MHAAVEASTSVWFPCLPSTVALARDFVRKYYGADEKDEQWLSEHVVSELATNVVVHGGLPADSTYRVTCHEPADDGARVIEVFDCSPKRPVVRHVDAETAEGGRGLALLEDMGVVIDDHPLHLDGKFIGKNVVCRFVELA